ncbi:hypothetical protein I6M70_17015 [Acinetobacter pittii]|uniref:hypothetical protein n=1 Tax=Acinetobacter pittii TaxID=48296 RepID=UPI00190126C9|nr:hypothetical protein [Acinetobacter pittii]MBJ8481061.1 hypothetical protein [Acinetobacter pittii]
MKAEIRTFVIDTCCWVVTISIIFFFFTLWLFSYNNIDEPLKESWSNTVSLLSALATIGAAIIASRLFQNWKTQHSFTEQIKILSQMLMRVDEIQDQLWEARTNDTLTKILMGQSYNEDLSICFEEQYNKFGEVSRKIMSLYKLENQIYLLNNSKDKHPIFKNSNEEDLLTPLKKIDIKKTSPLYELLNFIANCQIALMLIQSHLNEKLDDLKALHKDGDPEPQLSFKTVDFRDKYLSEQILNLLSRGEMYINMVYKRQDPEQPLKNTVNLELSKNFKELGKQIMAYRDKLEALD